MAEWRSISDDVNVRFGFPVGWNVLGGTGISDAGLRSPPSPTIKFIWGRHLKVAIRIVMIRRLFFGPTTPQLAAAVKPSLSVMP